MARPRESRSVVVQLAKGSIRLVCLHHHYIIPPPPQVVDEGLNAPDVVLEEDVEPEPEPEPPKSRHSAQ